MVLEQRLLSILLHWINSQVAVQPDARYFYKIDLEGVINLRCATKH